MYNVVCETHVSNDVCGKNMSIVVCGIHVNNVVCGTNVSELNKGPQFECKDVLTKLIIIWTFVYT